MNDIALVSLFLRGSLPEMAESNAVSEIKAREEAFRQAEPQYDTVTAGATAGTSSSPTSGAFPRPVRQPICRCRSGHKPHRSVSGCPSTLT
jgi:hypothetical protein